MRNLIALLLLLPGFGLAQESQLFSSRKIVANPFTTNSFPDTITDTNRLIFNVKSFGAVGDGKTTSTTRMASNSAVVKILDGLFTQADSNKLITIYKAGVQAPLGTSTNDNYNLSGTITNVVDSNTVIVNALAQNNITNTECYWGTDDGIPMLKLLHWVATNGVGGTQFYPNGIYMCGLPAFDTNLTGMNHGTNWYEPKNAQLYFPDPAASQAVPWQTPVVRFEGVTPQFYKQLNQSTDTPATNIGSVIVSTLANANGASLLSCLVTNAVAATYGNWSYRYYNTNINGNSNNIYPGPWRVEIDKMGFRTAGNANGPAVNLVGACTAKVKDSMIDAGYSLYNQRGIPSSTNGYGLILPTPSDAGTVTIEDATICGFWTGLMHGEHFVNQGLKIYSCSNAVEVTSGHPGWYINADFEDDKVWFNNRIGSICSINGFWHGENVPYNAAVWSTNAVLVAGAGDVYGTMWIDSSAWTNMDIPRANSPSLNVYANAGSGSGGGRWLTPQRFTNVTASSVSPNFIGLVDSAGSHGAYSIIGSPPFEWIDGSAVDGGLGSVEVIWANNNHQWRWGLANGGATYPFRFFNYTLGADVIKFLENGNVVVLSNNIVGVSDGSNPNAGNMGEFISSLKASGSAQALQTTVPTNITSISLTAGDWDVEANASFSGSTATVTATAAGIVTAANTIPSDGSEVYSGVTVTLVSETDGISLPRKRVSVSANTTVYLTGRCTFTAGSVSAFGSLNARRVR